MAGIPNQEQTLNGHSNEDTFPDLPPFPTNVPTTPLVRLSLRNLRTSQDEANALCKTAKELGFFYLDMRGDELGEKLLLESDMLFHVGREMYQLDETVLASFDYSDIEPWRSYFGYKGLGKGVVDRKGTRDRNQFYNAPKDDFLNQSEDPLAHPQPLMDNKELLASYCGNAHECLSLILNHLNTHLELPKGTLAKMHDVRLTTGDHVRFIRSPPQPPQDLNTSMGAHTDFGSLTLLFNRLGGLQILPPGSATFAYVRPLPGHAIINLGDALVKFSGGILRSNIHRVVAPPGEQSKATRESLVYFMRPGNDILLVRCKGGIVPELKDGETEERVTSWEWIRDKAASRLAAEGGKAKIVAEARRRERVTNKEELAVV